VATLPTSQTRDQITEDTWSTNTPDTPGPNASSADTPSQDKPKEEALQLEEVRKEKEARKRNKAFGRLWINSIIAGSILIAGLGTEVMSQIGVLQKLRNK